MDRKKKSKKFRQCVLRKWTDQKFINCIIKDSMFVLSFYLIQSGDSDVFIFPNIVGTKSLQLVQIEPWALKSFV